MTTASGSAEGDPLKEDWHEVTVKVESLGRKVFAADSMLAELLKKLRSMLHARGPDPDFASPDDDIRRLAHLIERLSRRPFNNGDGDGGDLRKWIAGVGVVLAAAFIAGGWTLSNQVAAQSVKIDNLTDQMKAQNERITRIEQQQRAN